MSKIGIIKAEGLINVVYQSKCPRLKGGGKLTYQIGERESDSTLHLRILENPGGGTYHVHWLCGRSIENTLSSKSKWTGQDLNDFMDSGDNNVGGFVLAALKDIGLVCNKDSTYLPLNTFRSILERFKKEKIESVH